MIGVIKVSTYDKSKIDRIECIQYNILCSKIQLRRNWQERTEKIPRELLVKLTDRKRLIQAENVVT